MSMHITFHDCSGVRLASTYVDNSNSVTLEITNGEGVTAVTLYGLPKKFTERLNALRDAETNDHRPIG